MSWPMVFGKNIQSLEKKFRIPYEEALNPAQMEAVAFKTGPLLVIAGAGSGKTRTLTYRVARLVEEGVPPNAVLLLTFTRKAAQEMLKRASQLLDYRCDRVSGGTFHGFAHNILRRYASQIGFEPNFAIIDRSDSENLISMLRKEMGSAAKHRSFPKKQTLANIFSRAANKSLAIKDVLENDYPHFYQFSDQIIALHHVYTQRKALHQFLDYDDLLLFLLTLLQRHPDICEHLSLSYQFIMVDEYQDTNKIQAQILYYLASARKNIMVVGDDSQSIYAFRGANFKNIITFPEIFPGAKVIRLEENYRSVQPILTLTNVMIEKAAEKFSKTLFTRKPGGAKPVLMAAESENEQSRFVVDTISRLSRNGIPLNQIAVLFRAGFHSFDLEIELVRDNIPYIKVGGFKFMESAHIKDLLAHLRVISNRSDRISWYRILLLLDQVGPRTAQIIYEAVLREKSSDSGLSSVKLKPGWAKGVERLKTLLQSIDSDRLSVVEMGEIVLEYYLPILTDRYDDHPKRKKDLEHLLTIMQRYRNLTQFLTDMALEPPNTSIDNTFSVGNEEDQRLTLSTIHSAKGLEWKAVFIIWALDGRFPSIHALNNPEEYEEELRLMYVAATRAEELLYFVYPEQVYDRNSHNMLSGPSRFIEDIDDDILEKEYL